VVWLVLGLAIYFGYGRQSAARRRQVRAAPPTVHPFVAESSAER
jgi:hypothetical protein